MKPITKLSIGAVVLSFGLAAAAVSAHPGGGYGMGPGHGPGWGMGGGMGWGGGPGWHRGPGAWGGGPMGYGPGARGMGFGNPGAMADARLASMKTGLGITAAQENAWQSFATQVKQRAETMQARMAAMRDTGGTAPERLAKRDELMKQHQAEREKVTSAFKDLYAVLTPEQKAIADRGFGPGPQAAAPGFRGPRGGYR